MSLLPVALERVMNFREGIYGIRPIDHSPFPFLASVRCSELRHPNLELQRGLLIAPKIARYAQEQAVRATKVHNTL